MHSKKIPYTFKDSNYEKNDSDDNIIGFYFGKKPE